MKGFASSRHWTRMLSILLTSLVFSTLPDIDADDAETLAVGLGGDRFGYQITSGDLDGDGNLDLVVTAPHPTGGNRAHVFFGPIEYDAVEVLDAQNADVTIEGPANSETGWAVTVGDLIGDGTDDLVISAPSEVSGRGRVHLFEGPLAANSTIPTASAALTIQGGAAHDYLGWSLTVGDYDGDGDDELGVGACGVGSGITEGLGGAYMFDFGGPTLPTSVNDALVTFKGSGQTGCAIGSGDFNGDGADELLLGSYGDFVNSGNPWGGSVALVYGRPQFDAAYDLYGGDPIDQDIALITSEYTGNNFGFDIATDDVNNDDYADLIIGAPAYRCPGGGCTAWDRQGRVYIIPGGYDSGPGTDRVLHGSSDGGSVSDTIYEADTTADMFGLAVASAGFSGLTFSRTNATFFAFPEYGPVIMVGSGQNEGWGLAYSSGLRFKLPAMFDCEWDPDVSRFRCELELIPNDPRQRRINVGNMNFGGHRFVGGPGMVFGFEVHGADLDGDNRGDLIFGATHQFGFDDPAGDGEAFLFQGR